jgi:hypothetical protein
VEIPRNIKKDLLRSFLLTISNENPLKIGLINAMLKWQEELLIVVLTTVFELQIQSITLTILIVAP